jgi:KDO2-lipid IV(A) lauroyltransferase
MSGAALFLRRLALAGAANGPELLLRGAPPFFGTLFWALRPEHRRGVRENLARIVGPRTRLASAPDEIRTFIAFARSFAEGMAALGPRADDVVIDVEGDSVFRGALAGGQGCIFATAHTSSFEVAGAALHRTFGTSVVMAMRAEKDADARAVSDGVRTRAGLVIEHVGDDPLSALGLAAHLRRGAAVGLQIDRLPPGVRGLPVTLFGRPAELPLGPFVLARATSAPIVPVFTRRTGFLRAKIRALEPVRVPRRATRAEMAVAAQAIATLLEAWVREAPTEWLDWGGA